MDERKTKITFCDPPLLWEKFNSFRNSPGIPFLRGFLEARGFDSEVINFNKIFSLKKNGRFLREYQRALSDFTSLQSFYGTPDAHLFLIEKGPEKIWEFVKENKTFDGLFFKYLNSAKLGDFVGLSLSHKSHLVFCLLLAQFIRNNFSGKKIIFGGSSFLIFDQEDLLKLLSLNPIVDYVVTGEGEEPLLRILAGESKAKIQNLIYLQDGNYKKNNEIFVFKNLNELPSPKYESGDIVTIQSSRRCYWNKCRFCSISDKNKEVCAPRKKEKILIDILRAKKISKRIIFADVAVLKEQIDALYASKSKLAGCEFGVCVRGEDWLDLECLKKAKRSGMSSLQIGPETFVPRLFKLVNKGYKLENVYRIINLCEDLKLHLSIQIIIGLPTQTRQELESDLAIMLDLIKKYKDISLLLKTFRLETGTYFYKNPKRFFIKPEYDKKKFLGNVIPFKQLKKSAISKWEAIDIFDDFYKKNFDLVKGRMVMMYIPPERRFEISKKNPYALCADNSGFILNSELKKIFPNFDFNLWRSFPRSSPKILKR